MEQRVIAKSYTAGKAQPTGTVTESSKTRHTRSVWKPQEKGVLRRTRGNKGNQETVMVKRQENRRR